MELLGGNEASKAPWPGDWEGPPLLWGHGRPTAFPDHTAHPGQPKVKWR